MSRAGLNRLTPHATPILLISANIPDIDIVTMAGGTLNYLDWHRHLTHSFLMAPVLALLSVFIVRIFVRTPLPWLAASFVALLGVLSHLLLDWTNQYGIRLLLPFSPKWYRLDYASLFDLGILSVYALCLFAPLVGKLVGGEIGSRPAAFPGRGWAITALLFLGVYLAGRGVIHGRVLDVLDSRVYDGAAALRVAAFPESATPFRWNAVVEASGAYHVYSIGVLNGELDHFDPAGGRTFFKPEKSSALDAAARTVVFQHFLNFAQYPLWQVTPSAEIDNGTQVDLVDLRFPFHCTALIDNTGRVVKSYFSFR